MTTNELERQLQQLQVTAELLVMGIVSLRRAIDEAKPKPEPPEPVEDESGRCLHPAELRLPVPSMGNPGRVLCQRCNELIGEESR